MRFPSILAAAAVLALAGGAQAQEREAPAKAADPTQQEAIDGGYRQRCVANAPAPLCECVIEVAETEIKDPTERQVFFDFMMGDVDKAKTARALLSPAQNAQLNGKLQRADILLGQRCDKLKPEKPN
jgi:hypothetical protein